MPAAVIQSRRSSLSEKRFLWLGKQGKRLQDQVKRVRLFGGPKT